MALAFRGRWHPSQWSKLPRVFPNGVAGGHNAEALWERFGFGLRCVGFGAAGILVGQSVGFGIGTWRSTQIIKREGNHENIARTMRKVQSEFDQRPGGPRDELGRPIIQPQQRRKIQGMAQDVPGEDGENSRLARSFERDTPAGETAWGEGAFAKDTSPQSLPMDTFEGDRPGSAVPASPEPKKRSRWEELRGQRSGQDSAWERIRQEKARQDYKDSRSVPRANSDSAQFDDRPASESFSEEQRRADEEQKRRLSKDKEREEYEKMFEKEARGEDSIYRSS